MIPLSYKMGYKQINLKIQQEFIETSNKLKNRTILTEDDDILFQLPAKSQNGWHCFIYQLGLMKAEELLNKMSKVVENKNDKDED